MTIGARRVDYLRGLARGSRHTPAAFGTGLAKFCRFVRERYRVAENAPAHALRLHYVAAFAEALPEISPALARGTRRNYVFAVCRFYRYLAREHVLDLPAGEFDALEESLRRMEPWQPSAGPRMASAEAIDALIVAARRCEEDVPAGAPEGDRRRAVLRQMRNEALVRVLASGGLRIGEALALARGDLDARRRSTRVREEHGKERTVYLSEEAWGALQRYLEMRGSGRGNERGEPVFARHDRGAGRRLLRLTRQRVEQMFDEWRKAAGLDEHVTPRGLRKAMSQ